VSAGARSKAAFISAAVCAAALAGCGGSTHTQSKAPAKSTPPAASAVPSSAQVCVGQWNSSGWPVRLMASNSEGYTLFAEVGSEDGVAGSCAVSAALPDYDSGFYSNVPGAAVSDSAVFFSTCTGGWCQGQSALVSSLPSTNTDWNAHISPDGSLALGVPQAVTHQQSTTPATTTPAATTTTPSAPSSCGLVSVKSGSISCATALAVANAAIASGQGGPNTTVSEQGFACYVYPYEIDCSSASASFDAAYGSTGKQIG